MVAQTFDVKDEGLAEAGRRRIEWAYAEMPVLRGLAEGYAKDRPLAGVRVAACLHVTTETANLMRVLAQGGAEVALCASNPLSTQDDTAAALALHYDIPTFAHHGDSNEDYYRRIKAVLDIRPQITLDDGADVVSEIHKNRRDLLGDIMGGTEETTTGVIRLRAMAQDKVLEYPIVAVNDADTKHLFDNRYGTGQSVIDGLLRATNFLIAGRVFTVAGYGWCGRGIAMRARGMGANVVVTEVDPMRALEAVMDGFRVMPMIEAAAQSDFIVSATGDKGVIDTQHFAVLKDGCVIANAGHFDVEINVATLRETAAKTDAPRDSVEDFEMADGRRIRLLAEGRLVNLAAAEGHPAAVMDLSFANQALSCVYVRENAGKLAKEVHRVPREIDHEIARLKLEAMGVIVDTLTAEQEAYLSSWQEGT